MKFKKLIGRDRSISYYQAKINLEEKIKNNRFDDDTGKEIDAVIGECESRISHQDIEQFRFGLSEILHGYDQSEDPDRDRTYNQALKLSMERAPYLVQPIGDFIRFLRREKPDTLQTVQVLNFSGKTIFWKSNSLNDIRDAQRRGGVFVCWLP